ncbi:hypothetical protein [Aestuariibaculum lutulentum]|uniref:Uncharacterized protein n=1 Tax=Aestuariibaculum lutulentum TaxID=2920935 RepID=A0ABS9RII9_9FLAO|nr:hypothetical protein [Aestuariibaculum lutulentum]MCH4552767.1 hypothetical protein [Aestuariibaculum lutulentum]
MIAIYVIGVIVGLVIFIYIGYYLWKISLEKYDYNIFNIGVIIRGLLAIGSLWFAMLLYDAKDGSSMILMLVSTLLWLWTFLATAFKTNIFIAVFSLLYQLFAVFLIKSAINKVLE